MKKKWSEEDDRIKEFVGKLWEYEMSGILDEEGRNENDRLSDSFYRKMNILVQKQTRKVRRKAWMQGIGASAAVFLIFFLIYNPGFVVQAANRAFEWFSDHVSFQFQYDSDVNEIPEYQIGYVPEGYKWVDDAYDAGSGMIVYYHNERGYLYLVYGVIDSSIGVDNENKKLLILEGKNNQEIYYLKSTDNDSSITWQSEDENTVFNLSGVLTEEELLKIYNSIKKVKK